MIEPLDVDLFHAGDERLFNDLVRDYSARILPLLYRYAQSSDDVHDLLQEVWLRAYQKRRTFSGRGSLFGWLVTICRTVGLAAVDKRTREPLARADELSGRETAQAQEYHEERELLRAAIVALPDRQREVVMLRIIEGRSTTDTARLMQCAEGTVKATLHLAIRKLTELLKERVA